MIARKIAKKNAALRPRFVSLGLCCLAFLLKRETTSIDTCAAFGGVGIKIKIKAKNNLNEFHKTTITLRQGNVKAQKYLKETAVA